MACGPLPPPYYVVDQQSPRGSEVPLNAPLQVSLQEHEQAGDPGVLPLNPTLSLVRTGSDTPLDLSVVSYAPRLAWAPKTLLEPHTSYTASLTLGYEGVPATSWEFTTGGGMAESLSLDGELSVTLEGGTRPIEQCGPCGNDCTAQGERAAILARIKLPRARGGFAPRAAWVWLTDEKPYDFSRVDKGGPEPYHGSNVSIGSMVELGDDEASPGGEAQILLEVPQEQTPYRPCFAMSASDARGDEVVAEPVCLGPFPEAARPSTGDAGAGAGAGAAGGPGAPNDAGARESRTSSACSNGPSPVGAHHTATITALFLGWALRRRAQRSS